MPPNCFTGTFVSLTNGATWTAKDAQGKPLPIWWKFWSPNGSRLLMIGSVARTNSVDNDAGGTLYLVPALGGTLRAVDHSVDGFSWIDETHVAIHRQNSYGDYPAGEFILTLPQ